MVSNQILAALRATAEEYLTDTCTLKKRTVVTGPIGDTKNEYTVVATGVACRLIKVGQQAQSQVQDAAAQDTLREMYKIAFPASTTIGNEYQVVVNSVTYDVVQVEKALTDKFFVSVIAVRRL